MKKIKNIIALILLVISFSRKSYTQEWEDQAIGSVGTVDLESVSLIL